MRKIVSKGTSGGYSVSLGANIVVLMSLDRSISTCPVVAKALEIYTRYLYLKQRDSVSGNRHISLSGSNSINRLYTTFLPYLKMTSVVTA